MSSVVASVLDEDRIWGSSSNVEYIIVLSHASTFWL